MGAVAPSVCLVSGSRILLLEDEEHLAFQLQFNLEAEGHQVVHASTCFAAMQLLDKPWDLYLLDLMLPDGSGVDVCRAIRERGDYTPVLMLTAKSSTEDTVDGLAAGADDYLTKPFALQELLVRVAARIRRQKWHNQVEAKGEALIHRFGAREVDHRTMTARGPDDTLDLTELEARLIDYLWRHRDRIVSRADLLRDVWNVAPDANTRAVDQFIARLRRNFETDPANPKHILTVRGVGYRYVDSATTR